MLHFYALLILKEDPSEGTTVSGCYDNGDSFASFHAIK